MLYIAEKQIYNILDKFNIKRKCVEFLLIFNQNISE